MIHFAQKFSDFFSFDLDFKFNVQCALTSIFHCFIYIKFIYKETSDNFQFSDVKIL